MTVETTPEERALGLRLAGLAQRLRHLRPSSGIRQPLDAGRLTLLLGSLHRAFDDLLHAAPKRPTARLPSREQLSRVLSRLAVCLAEARRRGDFINPWAVAGLKNREVRNAAALAWLLNPRESHGLGAQPIRSVVARLMARDPTWAPDLSALDGCTVRTEYRPQDSIRDRVDLAIYSPAFLLFLEVKISAPEGPEQLQRYLESAEAQARTLRVSEWRVAYLTVKPTQPHLGVITLTWCELVQGISAGLHGRAPSRSIQQLLSHFLSFGD